MGGGGEEKHIQPKVQSPILAQELVMNQRRIILRYLRTESADVPSILDIMDISPKTRMGQKLIEKWQNGMFQMEKKRRMMENVVYMVFIDFQGSHCFFLHFFKTHFPCKTDLDQFFQRFWNNFGGLFSGPGSSSIWWCWDPIGWGTWEKSWTWSKMNKDYRDPVTCFDKQIET